MNNITKDAVKLHVKNFMVENNLVTKIEDIEDDAFIEDAYKIGSLIFIDIIMSCEEQYGFEFEFTELSLQNFKTINRIADAVISKLVK